MTRRRVSGWLVGMLAMANPVYLPLVYGAPSIEVNFLAECNREPVAVVDPEEDETEFRVHLEGLVPKRSVEIEVRISPLGSDSFPKYTSIHYVENWKVGKEGAVTSVREIEFPEENRLNSYGRVWRAVVTWRQGSLPEESGKAYNDIYLATSFKQRFFAVTEERQCQWQGPLALASGYFFNDKDINVEVTSSFPIELHDTRRGLVFQSQVQGAQTQSLESTPLWSGPGWGWYFPQWEKAYGHSTQFRARQRWTLDMQQGGFFSHRKSFSRFRSVEYQRKKVRGCYQWKSGRSGWLDVATNDLMFSPVPREYGGDVVAALEFIQNIRPAQTTCDMESGWVPDEKFRVPLSDQLPMYFYPSL